MEFVLHCPCPNSMGGRKNLARIVNKPEGDSAEQGGAGTHVVAPAILRRMVDKVFGEAMVRANAKPLGVSL